MKQILKLPRGTIGFSASGQVTAIDDATILMKVSSLRQIAAAKRWLAA